MNFVDVNDRLAFHNGAQGDVKHLIHHILRRFIKRELSRQDLLRLREIGFQRAAQITKTAKTKQFRDLNDHGLRHRQRLCDVLNGRRIAQIAGGKQPFDDAAFIFGHPFLLHAKPGGKADTVGERTGF